ncbi:MAG: transposase [candidate division Zixibacteria bacterium]|nr:transposase [candidate division Zixibacteria bacterium]
MKPNSEKHYRRSMRLKYHDYSQAGGYFVTICAHNMKSVFGDVVKGEMVLSEYGKIVNKFWNKIPIRFSNVEIDWLVVMPNHVHGVIIINNECRGGVSPPHSQGEATSPLQNPTLGQIIAYFKYQTAKLINQIRKMPRASVWQRNYYEHVIRNEDKLNKLRYYIQTNPLKWHRDRENPERTGSDRLEDEIFRNVETNKIPLYSK